MRYTDLEQSYFEQQRMGGEMAEMALPPFHHGTHYSTSAYVLWFLMRLEPYTSLHIHLQASGYWVFRHRGSAVFSRSVFSVCVLGCARFVCCFFLLVVENRGREAAFFSLFVSSSGSVGLWCRRRHMMSRIVAIA